MMTSSDTKAETEAEQRRFEAALASAREANVTLPFWWRDDDAVSVTPALEELLDIQSAAQVPLALAVIPKFAEPSLMDRLALADRIAVLQHGYAHEKYSPAGEKASEFGESRPLEDSLADLIRGRERLAPMAGSLFLPVLTPPWNRIGKAARSVRHQAGLPGLSVFGAADGEAHVCNTHFDVIAWKTTRGFIGLKKAYHLLANEIERRVQTPLKPIWEPIGILTHHLVHDAETNAFLRHLFNTLSGQPHVTWPAPSDLFGV